MNRFNLLLCFLCCSLPSAAWAAVANAGGMSLGWCLPFAGILLSIALFPLMAEAFWHHHFGKIIAGLTASLLLPLAWHAGSSAALHLVLHAMLSEYVPFVILLLCLYTLSGGILLSGRLHATPGLNVLILALGALLAPVMGTTGAAMLLIRPLLRANKSRHYKQHVVLFFIFLVANIGGGLTPLGDPPLFLGFLHGVSCGWTFAHMLLPGLFAEGWLLLVFWLVDRHYFRKEAHSVQPAQDVPLHLTGRINFVLLLLAVASVLWSGIWKPGIVFSVLGSEVEAQNLLRDGSLLLLTGLSLYLTPHAVRGANEFNWHPMAEVAKLFAGIFITIVPVIDILRAGSHGALAGVAQLVTLPSGQPADVMYFWVSGILSSLLDNAPTYLVFFNLASGDALTMMGPLASTLKAISIGAVFMGAMTYIGNAPNLMVRNIASHHRVRMPGFFGYILWSGAVLLPLFVLESLLFL
jgi:Na+/H+ antiporter NhaD/arsenite permease-like protein